VEIETYRAIQVLALKNAEDQSFEAWYRSIERWYSEKFSTSLLEVEALPEEKVLETYFEDHYRELFIAATKNEEAGRLYGELRDSIIFPQETERAAQDDDAWADQMIAEIKADEEKAAAVARAAEEKKAEGKPVEIRPQPYMDPVSKPASLTSPSPARPPQRHRPPVRPVIPQPQENLNLLTEGESIVSDPDFKDTIPEE
jgi:hypothetical protein